MHRIAVFSDTHGFTENLTALRPQLGQVGWLLHAGDFLRDAVLLARELGLGRGQVRAVVGNCDYPSTEPAYELVAIGGVKILLVHGHQHGVKYRLDRLSHAAQEVGARVAIFGHSHVPTLTEERGILFFNPGSLTAPRSPDHPPSCGLLEVSEDGKVAARHLFLPGPIMMAQQLKSSKPHRN